MAHESNARRRLTDGVLASTIPVVDIKSIIKSNDAYKDLKDHALPAMKQLLNNLLSVMDTPKVGMMGLKKTKAENLKGEDKDAYDACFKGVRKEDIEALKEILRGDINIHTFSISYSFLETILKMADRTVACGPFEGQLKSILKEAKRLHGKSDSKTIGYAMHFIKKYDNVSAYIRALPQSSAAAAAVSAAKGRNEVAALQARLNALREGSSAGTAFATKRGGRRLTRRRRSRRATTRKH